MKHSGKETIMARVILTVVIIVLLNVFAGCRGPDTGDSQLMPVQIKSSSVVTSKETEMGIIEQMAVDRQAYRNGLESLINYYKQTGNNLKVTWAKNEIKALDAMPQYNYVIEATIAGPELRATTVVPEADRIYYEAIRLEKKAKRFIVIKDEDDLRVALNMYNELIRKYPASDKISAAAFHAAGILDYFKDYTLAVIYYQRTYQWDAQTIYPARYKAAYILDQYLARYAEAVELYQQAMKDPKLDKSDRDFAELRIAEITKDAQKVAELKQQQKK